jgi:hypothetical protein
MKKFLIVSILCFVGLSLSAQTNNKKDNDKTTTPTALSFTQTDQNQDTDSDNVIFFNVTSIRQNKNVSSQALLLDFKCPLTPINSPAESKKVLCTQTSKDE